MDSATFKRLLNDRKIAVVHFSHHAVMGHSVAFPDDLTHAINNYLCETRSCCALVPGHKMELPGSVGVIFEPDLDHVISVLHDDSGSSDYGGRSCRAATRPPKHRYWKVWTFL